MSDLVGNPEDRFSHDAAHINLLKYLSPLYEMFPVIPRDQSDLCELRNVKKKYLRKSFWF